MLLAIETSCDETSVSIVRDATVLANEVASQTSLHSEYGGVVPELATREHLRNLNPLIRNVCRTASIDVSAIQCFAATRGPGLPAALMAGYTSAKAMAYVLQRPLLAIHHHEAHLYSPWASGNPIKAQWDQWKPNVSLVVSGGHTMLVRGSKPGHHRLLGATLDDAAGECFDKVAKLLRLPYPGGPILDRLAEEGDSKRFDFPRSLIRTDHFDFSFSGLKTSVRYFLDKQPALPDDVQTLRDLCASVRAAIVDVLVAKTMRAAERERVTTVTASGGVTGNIALRRELKASCDRAGIQLRLALPSLCTDNAAMVGLWAEYCWHHGAEGVDLNLESLPGWPLPSQG